MWLFLSSQNVFMSFTETRICDQKAPYLLRESLR